MSRSFSLILVMVFLMLVLSVSGTIDEHQVQAAPVATGSIVLVARDLIDLKWDPSTFPNPSGETFLRWEIWRGTSEDSYTGRVRVGFDKTTDFYRDEGLAVDTTYYYKFDTVFYDPVIKGEKIYNLFKAEKTTGVFEGVIYETLYLDEGVYKLGSSLGSLYPSETSVVVSDGVKLSIGTGVTVSRPPGAGYKILAIGGNLHIDGASFEGVILYFGDPSNENSQGYGYVRNAIGPGIYLTGVSENIEIKNNKDVGVSLAGNSTADILENPSITYITLNDEAHTFIETNVISGMITLYDESTADIKNKNTIWGRIEVKESAYATITSENSIHGGVVVSGYGSPTGKKAYARIKGNTITSEYKNEGVDVYYGASAEVTDNMIEWTGEHETESSVLLHVSDADTSVTAERNKFLNGKIGIFWGATVTVTENVLAGHGAAITVGCVVCGADLQARGKIEKNTIQDGWGFEMWAGSEKEVDDKQALSIEHNCIRRNDPGLTTDDLFMTKPINVENNWWGHIDGPYHPTLNPNGPGDPIDGDKVLIEPWDKTDVNCRDEPDKPPAEPALLSVRADPKEIIPDGAATTQVRVEVYDDQGKPLVGEQVSFNLSPSLGKFLTSSCTSGVDGKCSVTYQAPEPGDLHGEEEVTVEAQVGNLIKTAEIKFVYLEVTLNFPTHGVRNVDWSGIEADSLFDREIDTGSVSPETFSLTSSVYYSNGFDCQYAYPTPERIRCDVDLSDLKQHPNIDKGLIITARLKGGSKGVKGKDGTFLRTDYVWMYYTTPTFSPRIIPVQISEGTALVAGRPAVVRVHGGLSEDTELDWVEADVKLTYPDGQSFTRDGHRFYPGELGSGEAVLTGNSANFYSSDGEVPIIDSGGSSHTLSTRVEPTGQSYTTTPRHYDAQTQVEVRLIKNAYAGYKVVAYPIAPSTMRGDDTYPWKAGEIIDDFFSKEVIQIGPAGLKYWFPFTHGPVFWPGDRVSSVIAPTLAYMGSWVYLPDLIRINGYRVALFVDVVVMLVPGDWLYDHYGDQVYHDPAYHVCVISLEAKSAAMSHCVGHLLGLEDIEWSYPQTWSFKGFDLSSDRYVNSDISGSVYSRPVMYRKGGGIINTWIDVNNYKQVFSEFTASTHAAGADQMESSLLAVGGRIIQAEGKDETGLIDVLEMPARNTEFPAPDGSGDYSLKLFDDQGSSLAVRNFTPKFSTLADGLDYASFMFTFSAPEETRKIQLMHGTKKLSTVTASSNPPQVTLTNPKAGSYSGELEVRWSGSDPDPSTELHYSLMYSQDGGTNWDVVVIDTTESSFPLDSAAYASCQDCRIKIIANDGFHSAEALTAAFSASNPPEVTWVWPADGYMDAGRRTEVVAVFRDAMNASSIGASTFTVKDHWGNPVPGAAAYNETLHEAVFTPDESLFYGRMYTAKLDSSIKDALGQSLGNDYTWTFRVELGPYPVYLPIVFGK